VIGLVLVAHSRDLVTGVAAIVRQAAPGVPVEGAGGLSGGRLGTSGIEVGGALRRALEAAAGSPIVVLLDLGSASMALEIGLEQLADGDRGRVHVTEAPFVEGAVLAAIAAAGGAGIDEVIAAAEAAASTPKLPRSR